MQSDKTLHVVLDSYLSTFGNLLDEMNKEHKDKCQQVKQKIMSIFPDIHISENTKQVNNKLKEEIEQLKIENDTLKCQLQKSPKIINHKMKIHLRHTQDWSYGIEFNIFNNEFFNNDDSCGPGVIEGIFPKNKMNYVIGNVKIISQTNTLDGQSCGMARSLTIDSKTGMLWTETPYGNRYGHNVTWNTIIELVITYVDL
jgi:hypothetical protein